MVSKWALCDRSCMVESGAELLDYDRCRDLFFSMAIVGYIAADCCTDIPIAIVPTGSWC